MMRELRARVEAKVAECVLKIEQGYHIKMPTVKVLYNLKGTTGGQAICGAETIRLNIVFLSRDTDHYIKQTVPHELAHLGVYAVWKTKKGATKPQPHGVEWQKMMKQALGVPDTRCHTYALIGDAKPTRRKYAHRCSVCDACILCGVVVHNKIQKGAMYQHVGCGNDGLLQKI